MGKSCLVRKACRALRPLRSGVALHGVPCGGITLTHTPPQGGGYFFGTLFVHNHRLALITGKQHARGVNGVWANVSSPLLFSFPFLLFSLFLSSFLPLCFSLDCSWWPTPKLRCMEKLGVQRLPLSGFFCFCPSLFFRFFSFSKKYFGVFSACETLRIRKQGTLETWPVHSAETMRFRNFLCPIFFVFVLHYFSDSSVFKNLFWCVSACKTFGCYKTRRLETWLIDPAWN